MSTTLNYYNQHAQEFINNTEQVNMQNLYSIFLRYLPASGYLLDVGCGSGRDVLNFKNLGYRVDGMDFSEELVKAAQALTNQPIIHQSFYNINDCLKYDGIWACASLLHCEASRLKHVIGSLVHALKFGGVLYMSFKYGDGVREKDGRIFTDMNEHAMAEQLLQIDNTVLLQQWISTDQRPNKSKEEWLNVILQKR